MRPILVIDTSVLIEVERGGFVEAVLALAFSFVVPRQLVESELSPTLSAYLVSRGLQARDLDGVTVAVAADYRTTAAGVSVVDAFCLALAKSAGGILLTGDGPLRSLATAVGVETHGLFWLLDRLEESGTVTAAALHAGLSTIAAHQRCRLPREQIRLRLARYAKTASSES